MRQPSKGLLRMATIIVATGLFVGSASITGKIIRMSGLLKARYSPALQLGLGGKAAELESLLAYTSDETKYVLLNREGDESSSTRAQLANHSSFKLNRRGTRSANTSASTQLSPAEIANRHVMQAAAEHIEPNISNRLKALLRQAGKTVKPKKPKKTTAEKMKEWRKKDVEWLQKGGISPLLAINKCIDSGNGKFPYRALRMWGCHPVANQMFSFTEMGLIEETKARLPMPSKSSAPVKNRCIEASSRGPSLSVKACDPVNLQQTWDFVKVPSRHKSFGQLRNRYNGLCITHNLVGRSSPDVPKGEDPPPLQFEPCYGGCNQTWSFGDRPKLQAPRSLLPSTPRAGKILCWILTYPAAADTKATAVNNTWGRLCDKLLYMTTEHVPGFETVKLTLWGPEGRDKLWTKSKLSWLYIAEHYADDYDWFIKADDDTYVLMDNLHRFLAAQDKTKLVHFGRRFKVGKSLYFSGGSGIVMSQATVKMMGKEFEGDADHKDWAGPHHGTGPEDLMTSSSLIPKGVSADPSVDPHNGRQLFMPMGIDHEYHAPVRDEKSWFYRYSKEARVGPECCSENWAAVHYIRTPQQYTIDEMETNRCVYNITMWPHLMQHDITSQERADTIRYIPVL